MAGNDRQLKVESRPGDTPALYAALVRAFSPLSSLTPNSSLDFCIGERPLTGAQVLKHTYH